MLTIEQAREMRQGSSLSGDRNQCAECGELFNSVTAFNKHRTGTIGVREGVDARRCMSLSEMRVLGMVKNSAGFWIKALMFEEARESLRESVTIPVEAAADPSQVLRQR